MSLANWTRLTLLLVILTGCARSTSIDDDGFIEDDDDAGLVGTGDGDAGGGGSKDASADGAITDGGSQDDGGADSDAEPPHPCEGVSCNTAPANECADAEKLRVYEPVGVCDDGQCLYESAVQPCAGGCASGACIDDPCTGVSCNTPKASHCKDEWYLTAYDAPGVCDQGSCSYTSREIYCAHGCLDDVCNGNPCEGKTCATPPANYCSGPNTLFVYDTAGACVNNGGTAVCNYSKLREEHCAHGCEAGKCKNDPCAGKSCNTPPGNVCKDATTAIHYAQTGTCAGGICNYSPAEVACPYGCEGGFCKDCAIDANCGAGKYCSNGVCTSCNSDVHCGQSCLDCAASQLICHAGACVQCTQDSQCGAGKFCSGNSCVSCDTAQKCGASCVACSGATPVCNGSACVCNESSCGSNRQCVGGGCEVCKSDSACGSTCSPCGGSTPFCFDAGTTSRCVSCRNDGHCAQGEVCDVATGACKPPCSPTATSVFSDAFGSPNSSSWTTGSNAAVSSSRWRAFTNAKHGVRLYNGRLEITNKTSGSAGHGHGYAYVKTGGADSAYDNTQYEPVLSANAGREVVWTLNMRRANPSDESTNGGFDCSSSSSQNGRTVGLAYVLATDSATGLNANASTCSASSTGSGYAVVVGGSRKVRLVRFTNGLRNGTITNIIESGNFTYVDDFFSVRVTYNATTHQWRLEARRDGTSSFKDPATGSYSFSGTATDSTYVNTPLEYSGPYFQTGCSGLCNVVFDAYYDNVNVATRCAP